jgi:hypothetical protein
MFPTDCCLSETISWQNSIDSEGLDYVLQTAHQCEVWPKI